MMIALPLPSQTLHRIFRGESTIDQRDSNPQIPGTEVAWLLVPVYVASPADAKQLAVEAPTRIEFAPAFVCQQSPPQQ